jgi:hypothetical protein
VFYNYILKCFVLIDLKIGKLTHQDIGQMDSYVRMFEAHAKPEGDNPTIGLILCSKKNEAIAKYSVLRGSKQLFAARYLDYLPTEAVLRRELERERRLIDSGSAPRRQGEELMARPAKKALATASAAPSSRRGIGSRSMEVFGVFFKLNKLKGLLAERWLSGPRAGLFKAPEQTVWRQVLSCHGNTAEVPSGGSSGGPPEDRIVSGGSAGPQIYGILPLVVNGKVRFPIALQICLTGSR